MFSGYIGFGIPAIGIGYLADTFGIVGGLLAFEIAILLLSIYLYFSFDKKTASVPDTAIPEENVVAAER
jgi:hypothetical protein